MSVINGMRITLSCENAIRAFVINGLNYKTTSAGDTVNTISSVNIYDPTFYLNMVRVDPTVDAQLIKSAQNPDDGNIRIHSQTTACIKCPSLQDRVLLSMSYPSK